MIAMNMVMNGTALEIGQRYVFAPTGAVFYVTNVVRTRNSGRYSYEHIGVDVESGKSPFVDEINLDEFGDNFFLLNGCTHTPQIRAYIVPAQKPELKLILVQGKM